jgi:hypothetical protein
MKTAARLLALGLILGSASIVQAADDTFATRLSGYNEVHFIAAPTPALRGAVSSPARGTFEARIDDRAQVIQYELTYEGLTGDVTQAHIHFGQRHTVGGIVVWLCQTAAAPAPAAVASQTPTCPGPTQGRVTGTITPAQVLEAIGQGIAAGELDEVVAAIRAGRAYANVHSATFPPGEIRGQIRHEQGRRPE